METITTVESRQKPTCSCQRAHRSEAHPHHLFIPSYSPGSVGYYGFMGTKENLLTLMVRMILFMGWFHNTNTSNVQKKKGGGGEDATTEVDSTEQNSFLINGKNQKYFGLSKPSSGLRKSFPRTGGRS